MTTLGISTTAPAALGFDTNTVLTAETASTLRSQGYVFCMRYVGLQAEGAGDLSRNEAESILTAGLLLGIVQHATKSQLDGSLGTYNGKNAATNAANVGTPAGVTLWCDLEGTNSTSSENTIAYVNAWASAVTGAGFVPGLYVGPNSGLSASQLYHSLTIAHYWKAASKVPWVDERGFQMLQGLSVATSAGVQIDPDIACYDAKGDRFTLVAPS